METSVFSVIWGTEGSTALESKGGTQSWRRMSPHFNSQHSMALSHQGRQTSNGSSSISALAKAVAEGPGGLAQQNSGAAADAGSGSRAAAAALRPVASPSALAGNVRMRCRQREGTGERLAGVGRGYSPEGRDIISEDP